MFLFDMDGTLIDSNGIWQSVDQKFLGRRGIPYTREYYDGVAHTILPIAAQFTKEYCHLHESCEEIIEEWMELAEGLYTTVSLKSGVRAYLNQCRAESRVMSLVTSSVPEHCYSVLERLHLKEYFVHIFLAQELKLEKGKSDIWRIVAGELPPHQCTVFDDSLSACIAAHAAGMRVVGVYDPYFAHDALQMRNVCDVYIQSFNDLLYTNQSEK